MKTIAAMVLVLVMALGAAGAHAGVGDAVEVSIVNDGGVSLPVYPVKLRSGLKKVYTEATKGEHYRIQVRNRLNCRVGVVVAVDGRNIISGEKSWLKNSERMYILDPYATAQFTGWRTAQDRVNRFYFTDVPDSYAAAFGDQSAMGMIAMAVYPELRRYEPPQPLTPAHSYSPDFGGRGAGSADRPAPAAPPSDNKAARRMQKSEQASESAGTGYGREEYAPSYIVAFEPETAAVEKIFLKYEWHATLCRLGVLACDPSPRRPPNRLWDNAGYAPPPPGRW